MGRVENEIAFEAFLAGDSELIGAAARVLGGAAGLIWRPIGDRLRPFGGWTGGAPESSGIPRDRDRVRSAFARGEGLPGRAWEEGRFVEEEDRVAIPIPAGDPARVELVVELFGPVGPDDAEREALISEFSHQVEGLLRDTRPDQTTERLRRHMAEVVEGSQDAVMSKDLDGIVTSWNPAAEAMYGYSAAEAIGRHISFLVPADHKDEEMRIIDRIRAGERLRTYETERIRKDGARIDVSLTVSPIESGGELLGASVIARDVTAEKRNRRAEAFLVAASRRLDASLDPIETANTIVRTAVPELAEICVIDFLRIDGRLGDSIAAAVVPGAAERLATVRRETPLDPDGSHPVAQVLRAGIAMSWRDLTDPEVIDQVAQNGDHRQLLEEAGYRSAAVVPLVARGRTIGTLSFIHTRGDLRYDPDDLAFLSELGDRAALALDNAQLYEERTRIADDLQRGLRPPTPAPVPGLEIAVVFEPSGARIGGDFYDVMPTDDGCWILIGDVAGKGSAAAAVSVAIRHTVRALCQEIEEPRRLLTRINEQLRDGTTLNDFATAQLLRMRRGERGWSLTLAAAGHPPAIHVTADGARQLGGGVLLGGWDSPAIASQDVELGVGEHLVLSTDGWFEIGPVAEHFEPDALARLLEEIGPGPDLTELTERLRADAVKRANGPLEDDLVILAVAPAQR